MIVFPAMGAAQEQAWIALLDLYDHHPDGWTLIGGQMFTCSVPSESTSRCGPRLTLTR